MVLGVQERRGQVWEAGIGPQLWLVLPTPAIEQKLVCRRLLLPYPISLLRQYIPPVLWGSFPWLQCSPPQTFEPRLRLVLGKVLFAGC